MRVYWLKSKLIWVDGFSAGIEPGTCGQHDFLKSRALLHWAMVTDATLKILQDPLYVHHVTNTAALAEHICGGGSDKSGSDSGSNSDNDSDSDSGDEILTCLSHP